MRGSEIQIKRWKRLEYEQLVEQGVFMPGERVELIDGLLLVAEPQSSSHYSAVRLAQLALTRAFGDGWDVRGLTSPCRGRDQSEASSPAARSVSMPSTHSGTRIAWLKADG